jgi:large subunit ribosomal protein L21
MYAVVKTGGKQHRVREGDLIRVEKLQGDVGSSVTFDHVLMVAGEGDAKIGTPILNGASVEAEIVQQTKSKKVLVFKKKRRKNYRRMYGHRQPYTHLRVNKIVVS